MHVSDALARVAAPAKINLYLRVGPRRDDGFHPLLTWMCTIGLFDMLEFVPAPAHALRAWDTRFELICSDRRISSDRRNLVFRAADAIADVITGVPGKGGDGVTALRVRLDKRIPVGAGLGGGSSDAAHTLIALNRLWKLNLSQDRLHELAATLGSDVPFFLHGPSSICRGRGDLVQPIARPKPRWAVLVLPGISLLTAEVYGRFDQVASCELRVASEASDGYAQLTTRNSQLPLHEPPWEEWTQLPAQALLPMLENDLEPAAFSLSPDLTRLREDIEQHLSRPVRMSGSGSALFTLYDDQTAATNAAAKVSKVSTAQALAVEIAPATV